MVKQLNFYIPDKLLEEFDRATEGRYRTRAEAVRVAMRQLIDRIREEDVKYAEKAE